jgi:Flp pilus assembly pilin Flp
MTEIIIIVFLVAIGAIGVAGLFGDNIRGLFGASSESLAGESDVDNPGQTAGNVKWNMKGGSLSPYGAQVPTAVPAGTGANGGNKVLDGMPGTPTDNT